MYSNDFSFKFYHKKRPLYWAVLLLFIFCILSLYAAQCHRYEDVYDRIDYLVVNHIHVPLHCTISIFWFSVVFALFFGLLALLMTWELWRGAHDKKPCLIINQDALVCHKLAFRWHDIAVVTEANYNGNKILIVILKNPEKYFSAWTYHMNYILMGYHYAVSNIDAPIQDIVEKARYMIDLYNLQSSSPV